MVEKTVRFKGLDWPISEYNALVQDMRDNPGIFGGNIAEGLSAQLDALRGFPSSLDQLRGTIDAFPSAGSISAKDGLATIAGAAGTAIAGPAGGAAASAAVGALSGGTTSPGTSGSGGIASAIENWFGRAIVIIIGFIFVAVGLSMFKIVPLPPVVKAARDIAGK